MQNDSFARAEGRGLYEAMRLFFPLLTLMFLLASRVEAQQPAPRENPYDVIAKIFQPLLAVLLTESNGANRAASIQLEVADVGGRLPQEMKGATLEAEVQFPDKVKVAAPVLGETITVCRNGDEVWATPGSKVEYLISQFQVAPRKGPKLKTPVPLPITPQQAIFPARAFFRESAGCGGGRGTQRRELQGSYGGAHAGVGQGDGSGGFSSPRLGCSGA